MKSNISLSLINNYLKIAIRMLVKHKYFTIVNVFGLAVGMTVGLLFITLYSYILTYDDFHAHKSLIYRVTSIYDKGNEKTNLASAPTHLADKLEQEYTGISKTVRIHSNFSDEITQGKWNIQLRGYFTEPSFLSTFSFPLIAGNPQSLLRPNTVVLTASVANKIFNSTDVVGKILVLKELGNTEIVGVMKDLPQNTHLQFEALVSLNSVRKRGTAEHLWTDVSDFSHQFVYLLLSDASKVTDIQTAMSKINMAIGKQADTKLGFQLQSLADITPTKDPQMLSNNLGTVWDRNTLFLLGGIALLVLLPACFNYTNISIARAMKRSKEIGLRKTMGGEKHQIFFQFITETVVVAVISLMGAVCFFALIRPEFQNTLFKDSSVDLGINWTSGGLFLLLAIFTGIVAGIVPAWFFSGLNPTKVLKNQTNKFAFSGTHVRKGLSILQFALSFGFIMTPIVLIRQYNYSLNFDFGFQRKSMVNVALQGVEPDRFNAAFSNLFDVKSLSFSSGILGLGSLRTYPSAQVRGQSAVDSLKVYQMYVDNNYVENMGLKLLAGAGFPDEVGQNERFIMVNEAFLKANKIPHAADAIGKTYHIDGKELEVAGVLKDFHFTSLRDPIKSFMFRFDPSKFVFGNLNVAFTESQAAQTRLEKHWATLESNQKIQARFLDNDINDVYEPYRNMLKIFGFLGLITITISLLGLLGMVVYTSEVRTKEVGIRKVMGASTMAITVLLSKDYLKLISVALAIGIPITFFLLDNILPRMQYYGVKPELVDVLLSLFILLAMGLATIASQTVKIASTNPAHTLRTE